MNKKLGQHENVASFFDSFSIDKKKENQEYYAIIMPYFPRSVADFYHCCKKMSIHSIAFIARDCFHALSHIHSAQYCFGDLKPDNIMIKNQPTGSAVLVDFGAAEPLGQPLKEYSPAFCLDMNTEASVTGFDWVCLGSTLTFLSGFDLFLYKTRSELKDAVEMSTELDPLVKKLISSCLGGTVSDISRTIACLTEAYLA